MKEVEEMLHEANTVQYGNLNTSLVIDTLSVLINLVFDNISCNEDVIVDTVLESGNLLDCVLDIDDRYSLVLHLITSDYLIVIDKRNLDIPN